MPAEAGGLDFVVVGAQGFGYMIEPHGTFVDDGLQFEHFAEAGG